ncbi:MAG TPA: hypothetical protein VJ905_03950, partial [Halalkalibaculum sp.]|nr:hypothetical protein [Halalkalibaculum sp.]
MANEQANKEKFEELCAGYVLNALEPEEREEFEILLQNASEEERELYQEMRSAANQIAFSVEGNQAPGVVRERILAQVQPEENELSEKAENEMSSSDEDTNNFDRGTFAIAASFALLLVTLSLVFYSFNLSTEISNQE